MFLYVYLQGEEVDGGGQLPKAQEGGRGVGGGGGREDEVRVGGEEEGHCFVCVCVGKVSGCFGGPTGLPGPRITPVKATERCPLHRHLRRIHRNTHTHTNTRTGQKLRVHGPAHVVDGGVDTLCFTPRLVSVAVAVGACTALGEEELVRALPCASCV